jgi:hypothetical protein
VLVHLGRPHQNGVFGRHDWLANGVLFAAYHLHEPWIIPTTILDAFVLAYPGEALPPRTHRHRRAQRAGSLLLALALPHEVGRSG